SEYTLYEPTLHLTPSGKLVVFCRSSRRQAEGHVTERQPLLTAESFDGGRTWSHFSVRRFASPSPFHALRLNSGNVLVTYGYRHKPYAIRAFLLDAECTDFEQAKEIVLRDDGSGFDLGYTSAVQLPDGHILVTYYYDDETGTKFI